MQQQLFLDEGCSKDIGDELRKIGTKRILVICPEDKLKYKSITSIIDKFKSDGFRVFVYSRIDTCETKRNILGAANMYREFNCNTIVAIGGGKIINIAKLTASMVGTRYQDYQLESFIGINNVPNKKATLCLIVTDASTSSSSAYAEYVDQDTMKREICFSGHLVPQIVLFDSDVSMRYEIKSFIDSALEALSSSIDTIILPHSSNVLDYKANAVNACLGILNNIENMRNNPGEPYLRRQMSVEGFYSGLASRVLGPGYGRLILNEIASRYEIYSGALYLRIMAEIIDATLETCAEDIESITKQAHFTTRTQDSFTCAQIFMDNIRRISAKNMLHEVNISISELDAFKIADSVKRQAHIYGSDLLTTGVIAKIVTQAMSPERSIKTS